MSDIKTRWDERDFEQMGWHDVHIHAVAHYTEVLQLRLDIDYILQWINPPAEECRYRFLLAPATMVFDLVSSIKLDINTASPGLFISRLHQSVPIPGIFPESPCSYDYRIELEEGCIAFNASGFRLYMRQPPQEHTGQWLSLRQRGGISVEVPQNYGDEDEQIWKDVTSWYHS
ncbi:Uncharacterised protein [Leminorella richardii]|uniref:Uncharacterized protein n=1 Tax=Leminorella richardii TaxID=158841 RepID=A0A2X4ULU2_9GAMM|nr:hypothetical protein [Leminorella richardii]SQI33910.1 Uncharacterised protein [Leminorella richardii]